jgi:hypothetical protein
VVAGFEEPIPQIRLAHLLLGPDRRIRPIHPVKPGLKPGSVQGIAWGAQTFTAQDIHWLIA